jgi:two-component system, sensor histidine kinase and response regulator
MPGESILVVEDEVAVRDLILDILKGEGYRVTGASDGVDGLVRMASANPDLVVSDVNMPRMGGLAFCDAVRSRPEWDRIPFIFLSGQGEQQDVLAGKRRGADDYLCKPFSPDALLVSVRSRLDRQGRLDSLRDRQVDEVKKAILMIMNHEIRTPVTWLQGGAELLRDTSVELDRNQIREMLDGILAGSERLVRLAENLLALVDFQTGEARQNFEKRKRPLSDLEDILRACIALETPHALGRGVRIELELPDGLPRVTGDPEMLEKAIRRLLDNAVKFSNEPGSVVTLAVGPKGKQLAIEVRDRGVGIRAEDLLDVPDLFVQSARDKQEQQGTGTGLTVVREIAILHGGALELQSELGRGTTARLLLPCD